LPGDDVSAAGGTKYWFLIVVALTWAAAARRSAAAWSLLVLYAIALVLLSAGLVDGYGLVTTVYLMLGLLAVGLLLWPASRAHVWSDAS
jgi:hypothetical protein